MAAAPVRLTPSFREKIWGTTRLSPWFPDSREKTGEVWFLGEREFPVLIKFIFTSERLSVQVHPDDDYARRHEASRGKSEMWHILRAEPGAKIAAGFRRHLSRPHLREASLSGEIDQLLAWREVKPGETYFTPSGTVHAIGGGIVLCEIQQNSDITYRLYDYGRPRELHLDKGVEVSDLGPHPGPQQPHGDLLVISDYFITSSLRLDGGRSIAAGNRLHFLVVLEGSGTIAGEPFRLGEVWHVPPGAGEVRLEGSARLLHVTCQEETDG
ncbi:MAG TPA: class I mannose-6-phosphate isomerase [Bryobacteraceae bacterium]|nr:class I mannose-6-phosphate isomerase [Bryobacteraceae bacterium]